MSLNTGPGTVTLKGNLSGSVVLLITNSFVSSLVDLSNKKAMDLATYIKSKRQDNSSGVDPLDFQSL